MERGRDRTDISAARRRNLARRQVFHGQGCRMHLGSADGSSEKLRINPRKAWYGNLERVPSRPGEFHPEPLTDPDVILSHHPARATERRLPPPVENWSSSCCQLAHSQRR